MTDIYLHIVARTHGRLYCHAPVPIYMLVRGSSISALLEWTRLLPLTVRAASLAGSQPQSIYLQPTSAEEILLHLLYAVCLHIKRNLETMHDLYLPTFSMRVVPIVSKRTRTNPRPFPNSNSLARITWHIAGIPEETIKAWSVDPQVKVPTVLN